MSKPTIRELLDELRSLPFAAPETKALAERVEAVLKLHQHRPNEAYPHLAGHCSECHDDSKRASDWPCETIRALNGEQP